MRSRSLLVLAGLALGCAHGSAAGGTPASDRLPVRYEYVEPTDPDHRVLYDKVREHRVLEQLAEAFSVLRLPRTLTLRFRGCDGTSNAWYDPRDTSVTFCYEYVAEIERLAATHDLGPVPLDEARAGPVLFVFLHETGHAVFDLLQVPIMGREEDAADNFATVLLLRLGPGIAFRTLRGTAWQYAEEARSRQLDDTDFSDVHSLDAQRYYNILCLAYGSDRRQFALVVEDGYLPKERAEGCAEEYGAALYAMRKLIVPAMDPDKAQRYLSSHRKQFATGED